MAEETNQVQFNVTAEATVLNNFVNPIVTETNEEKAEASFIKLEEIKIEPFTLDNLSQTIQTEQYVSPKIEEVPNQLSRDYAKLAEDFQIFKSQLNKTFPKRIDSLYREIYALFDDLINKDKQTDPRPVRPLKNAIFDVRSGETNNPPSWS